MTSKPAALAAIIALNLAGGFALAQAPGLTPGEIAMLARIDAGLAAQNEAVKTARAELLAVALTPPRNEAAIEAKVEAVGAAELALATARADAFAKLQVSPEQLPALSAAGATRGGPASGTLIPNVTNAQMNALTQMTTALMPLTHALRAARMELSGAAIAAPRNDVAIRAKAHDVSAADLALANARADALAKIQDSPVKLAPDQITALIAMGGAVGLGGFTEPQPLDFNDHQGYVSLFDGVSLKGWDGNPKFWRAENGAIVGESTPEKPSGNTYIVYRGVEAKDFTLKFEIKVEGSGGSGLQYRSKTGIPWLAGIPSNVTAYNGPVNLNWMMTGPQADFWPSQVYSGQFYSENTPMRIMAWRGQVVEGAGFGPRRLMGTIGGRKALGDLVKMDDWNEYTVIARGGTFIHILNGQLMAVMIDDDPESSNNQPGLFGIEIEATTKVSVRDIWLKKLN